MIRLDFRDKPFSVDALMDVTRSHENSTVTLEPRQYEWLIGQLKTPIGQELRSPMHDGRTRSVRLIIKDPEIGCTTTTENPW